MPALRRVAVLWNAGNPSFTRVCQSVDAAPTRWAWCWCRIRCASRKIPGRISGDRVTTARGGFCSHRMRSWLSLGKIVEFASREELASASTARHLAALGGLMSYGPSPTALQRQGRRLRRPDFRRRKPRYAAVPEPDNVRGDHKSQDCKGARPQGAAIAAGTGRRRDR